VKIPLPNGLDLLKSDHISNLLDPKQQSLYEEIAGSLNHLALSLFSRADIAFAVSKLSQSGSALSSEHLHTFREAGPTLLQVVSAQLFYYTGIFSRLPEPYWDIGCRPL
jgi:hypothetical protein